MLQSGMVTEVTMPVNVETSQNPVDQLHRVLA